jgi:Flp pilus assembly protein TadG
MFVLLLLGGLVVDGSRQLNARGDARAYAEEAARAGATAIDTSSPGLTLDQQTAMLRVNAYCHAVMDTFVQHSNVTVTKCEAAPDEFTPAPTCNNGEQDIVVNTVVTVQTDNSLLGMIGIAHFSSTATASARPYEQTFKAGDAYC